MPDPKKGSKISLTPHFDFFEVNHNRPFFGGSGIITEGSIMIAKLVILTYVVVWNHQLKGSTIIENDVRPHLPENPLVLHFRPLSS